MISDQDIERLMREDQDALCRDAKIPSAGLVYWRASIRARAEAARKVEQPFTIVHGLTAAAVAGVGAALARYAWPSIVGFESPLGLVTTIALCAAALVVISPLALVALASRMRFDRPQD